MKGSLMFLNRFETNKIEYKEAKEVLSQSIWKSISAFANIKGTGFKTEVLSLKKSGFPEVQWINDEKNDTFTTIFPYPIDTVTPQVEKRDRMAKLLLYCDEPRALKEIRILWD